MGLGKSKPKIPQYDASVQKRIQQLYAIKSFAEELSGKASSLADQFNVIEADGKKNHNVALGLAVRLHIHGTYTQTMSPQYGMYLLTISELYDAISREQAIFLKEIHDKVIDPLKSWLQVEYRRMDAEIQKLHNCTLQYNLAKKSIAKKNIGQTQLMLELARKELQLQMDVVISELLKLRTIKETHHKYMRDLIKTLSNYYEKVGKLLEAKRIDP